MPRLVEKSEALAARRRCYFDIRLLDGISPAAAEVGGQPQVDVNGSGWTNTGVGPLKNHDGSAVGANPTGRYNADLDTSVLVNVGDVIESRYKSAATAETPGDTFQVVGVGVLRLSAGKKEVRLTIRNTNQTPVPGADVWCTGSPTDSQGDVKETGITDASGQVTFFLDPGTYYVWAARALENFAVPQTLIVDP